MRLHHFKPFSIHFTQGLYTKIIYIVSANKFLIRSLIHEKHKKRILCKLLIKFICTYIVPGFAYN